MKNAVYAAKMERSVGLGAMGFHSFLQKKGIPFESAIAKSWNAKFFKHLKKEALRLVNSIPSMVPAKQRGKAVKCNFTLPISFSLQ